MIALTSVGNVKCTFQTITNIGTLSMLIFLFALYRYIEFNFELAPISRKNIVDVRLFSNTYYNYSDIIQTPNQNYFVLDLNNAC